MNGRKLFPLVVVAAGLLAYSNSFTGGFLHDDFGSIPENPTIRHLWPIWQPLSPPHQVSLTSGLTVEGRPLLNLSLAINYALGGYDVWGYHALNLAVHILAGLTLFGIVRRTLLRTPRTAVNPEVGTRSTASIWPRRSAALPNDAALVALAVAVLWVVHPLQTESVTYIVQRAESMMGLFYLLTLYCFIRGAESVPVQSPVGTRFIARIHHERCSASVAALERGPTNTVAELELGPTGSAALPSALWYSLSVVACALGMASKEVMITAPLMVLLYDRAFLSSSFRETWRRRWPVYLMLGSTWIVLGFVLASGGNLATASRNARHIGITRWEYLVTQPGVILYYLRLSVWPSPLRLLHEWPIARTWTRILPPTIVLVMLVGAVLWACGMTSARSRARQAWGFVGAWFFLILAASSSFVPALDAVSEHRMYLSLAAVVTVVVIGLWSLAGRYGLAVVAMVAIGLGFLTWRRNEDYRMNPHYSMGLALGRAGRIDEAIDQFEQALRTEPDHAEAHYNLGLALEREGRFEEAVVHWEQTLRIRPDFAEGHNSLGCALARQGRMAEAIGHWEQALQSRSDFAEAHYNLGLALQQAGHASEAIEHYRQALRLNPDIAEAHNNLGIVLQSLGKTPEAIEQYEQALLTNPNYAEAHYSLGMALAQLGRVQEAISHYEQALRLKPDFAEAQRNLSRLQAVQ